MRYKYLKFKALPIAVQKTFKNRQRLLDLPTIINSGGYTYTIWDYDLPCMVQTSYSMP